MNTRSVGRFQKGKKIRATLLAVAVVALLTGLIFAIWWTAKPMGVRDTNGNITTSWSADSVSVGDEVKLAIDVEPETDIDTVMTKVEFNPDQLKYRSVSYEGTAFSFQLPEVAEGDSVKLQIAVMGSDNVVSEKAHVAEVMFEALSDHRPSATVSGDVAKAGESLGAKINGKVVKSEEVDRGLLLWRWAYSALAAFGLAIVGVIIFWIIKRGRKGRIQK